jgi:polyisoprenyl-teichoic acid--peptidoglycan teichoic acid transferase
MQLKKFLVGFFLLLIFSLELVVKGGSISPLVFQLLFNKNIELRKTEPERVNLLLLGIGGEGHEGPNLSDTIIFASLDTKTPKITLISLPRDLWIDEFRGRINKAYAIGEQRRQDGGLVLAKAIVKKVTGQNVDYAAVIDFSGFVTAVDQMGGLDIDVERTFDDFEYPVAGKEDDLCGNKPEDVPRLATASSQVEAFPCRYTHLHFEKGRTHMNGETALKFVRSRHAKGPEGTDFARSKRQEKVIQAFMNKAFSLEILANPGKVAALYGTVQKSVNTDIRQNEFDDFIKLAQKLQKAKLESVVIDYGDREDERGGLLTHPEISKEYNFEWTLIPRAGRDNYSEIHEYVRCRLYTDEECIVSEIP